MSKFRYKNNREESALFKKIKSYVRKRDCYTCQLCGKKTKYLHVHHIREWSDNVYLRYDKFNLISLDGECHRSIKGKEFSYIDQFMKKVFENERKYNERNGNK